jgi:hypothetical protein
LGSGLISLATLALALTLSACGPRPSSHADEMRCDRGCLEDTLTAYLRALIARNPSGVPLAAGARLVEDLQPVAIGEGTWTSVTGVGGYRHVVADLSNGRVSAIVVVEEGGGKVVLDVSLQVVNREIAHVESMMVRDTAGAGRYEQMAFPPAAFSETVPQAQRVSRQALEDAVGRYYAAMDPRGARDLSSLADNCERMEHGNSASLGCRTQFDAGFLPFVTRVRDRRYLAVDEERQTVFATVFLDHDGSVRTATQTSGATLDAPAYFAVPRTLQLAEVLRLEGGRIRYIETTLAEYPYGSRPVPASLPPTPAAAASPGPASGCDRDCLRAVVARWLDVLVARRRDALFETPGLRYTENGQPLPVGDGLWRTVTAVSRDRRVLVDPDSGTAGVFTGVTEHGVPGALAARFQMAGGKVTELEVVVVRQELAPPDGETATLFGPRLPDAYDPARFASDWAAFERASGDAGRLSLAPAPLAAFRPQSPRERRQLVRDAAADLMLELTVTDVTGAQRGEAATTGPFAILAVSVSRTREGQTVSHGIVRPLPFGSRSGWTTPAPRAGSTGP